MSTISIAVADERILFCISASRRRGRQAAASGSYYCTTVEFYYDSKRIPSFDLNF